MITKIFKIILPLGVLILFLIKVVPDLLKDSNCDVSRVFFETSLNGIVERKYIDSEQHSYKTIVLKNFNNEEVKIDYLDFDTSNFFDLVSTGDSIYKRITSDSVFIYKDGKKAFFSKPYFGCNPK